MATTSSNDTKTPTPASEDARAHVLSAIEERPRDLLSAGGTPTIDRTFANAERTMLDGSSWVDVVPGWVTSPDALFQEVARAAPWQQHWRRMYRQVFQEPRFTAAFDSVAEGSVPFLSDVVDALSERYDVRYDSVWMNFYRDESKGTGWHADRPADKPPTSIVPLLSLGALRRFLIKPKDGGSSTVFTPASGDLLVMGGRAQRDWIHSAPKQTKPAGPRISLNFGSSEQNAQRENDD